MQIEDRQITIHDTYCEYSDAAKFLNCLFPRQSIKIDLFDVESVNIITVENEENYLELKCFNEKNCVYYQSQLPNGGYPDDKIRMATKDENILNLFRELIIRIQ